MHFEFEDMSNGVQRGGNGAMASDIQRMKLQKLHFIKILQLHASSCCKATNTCCMDLMGTCK